MALQTYVRFQWAKARFERRALSVASKLPYCSRQWPLTAKNLRIARFADAEDAYGRNRTYVRWTNTTPESLLLQAVKILIRALPTSERAMLRPRLLAMFDVQGHPQSGFVDRGEA